METLETPHTNEQNTSREQLGDHEIGKRFETLRRQLEGMDSTEVERLSETATDKNIQGADFAGMRKSHQAPPSIFESR